MMEEREKWYSKETNKRGERLWNERREEMVLLGLTMLKHHWIVTKIMM
jgi:hypothetical protein